MALDLDQVKALLEDRPYKFSEEAVDYRPSSEQENQANMRCGFCHHHYRRVTDRFGVCEILRSERIDREGIDPDYVCRFYSKDGEKYPLAEESK